MTLYADLTLRLAAALTVGALIGLERTYHGRAAGFRTHALVCMGAALLMTYGAYAWALAPEGGRVGDALAASSRIAQGVMTGIGFLGAGIIFKEGMSIHGLTTAASIWVTAAIGLLIGAGFWYPAGLGLVAVLVTLSVLRWAEDRLPRYVYFDQAVKFAREGAPAPEAFRALLHECGFRTARLKQRLNETTGLIEYRIAAFTLEPGAGDALVARLKAMPNVLGFDIIPTDD